MSLNPDISLVSINDACRYDARNFSCSHLCWIRLKNGQSYIGEITKEKIQGILSVIPLSSVLYQNGASLGQQKLNCLIHFDYIENKSSIEPIDWLKELKFNKLQLLEQFSDEQSKEISSAQQLIENLKTTLSNLSKISIDYSKDKIDPFIDNLLDKEQEIYAFLEEGDIDENEMRDLAKRIIELRKETSKISQKYEKQKILNLISAIDELVLKLEKLSKANFEPGKELCEQAKHLAWLLDGAESYPKCDFSDLRDHLIQSNLKAKLTLDKVKEIIESYLKK